MLMLQNYFSGVSSVIFNINELKSQLEFHILKLSDTDTLINMKLLDSDIYIYIFLFGMLFGVDCECH